MDVSVRSGDSLTYYSQLFSLPFQTLIDANRSVTPNQLLVGMKVSIPGYRLVPYKIQEGDSLWRISERLEMPLDRLILINQTMNPATMEVDQFIQVPKRITERVNE
ncbi:LysM peptidoglycan-binding domain-containing protein [Alkalihalobacillus deserti]|uniref:LysM peptidoglycan-binding domain-containing protein n=1 Tax=Alkalihalobacillus deserti TaxID=2879466 RepID=UPI001D14C603|nr:LysM domain-containing protein [Alkalihalobacillus deserti]